MKIEAAARLRAYDNKWSQKVGRDNKLKYSNQKKPVELDDNIFSMSPSTMVQRLKALYKDDFKAAMSAVSFVANRAGRKLSPSDKERFQKTKELLRHAYGKETTNVATRPR